MENTTASRRELLKNAALFAAAAPLVAAPAWAQQKELLGSPSASTGADPWKGLKVGVASYTFVRLPLEVCIDGIKRLDMHYVSIKDKHLPMNSSTEQRKAVVQKFKDAGIAVISCGVVDIKNEAEANTAFSYAKDIGVPVIVAYPRLDTLPLLDKLVKQHDIKIAIHNHGPENKDYKSPYDAMNAIEKFDKRIGLCIDVGHTKRAGVEPVEAIRKCKERLYDVHMKDIAFATGKNVGVEVGRGVLDIRGMLQALLDIGFKGHVGFEFEKAAENPLPGLAESIGYTKGVISDMKPAQPAA